MNTQWIANAMAVGIIIYILFIIDKKTGFYSKISKVFGKKKKENKVDNMSIEQLKEELEKEKIRSEINKLK